MEGVRKKVYLTQGVEICANIFFFEMLAKALYSLSIEDNAITRCLEDFHDMRLEPK